MVERVARAMIGKVREKSDAPIDLRNFLTMARAAIEAMRVPTGAMVDRYLNLAPMLDDWPDNPPAAIPAWQAMIDEALK